MKHSLSGILKTSEFSVTLLKIIVEPIHILKGRSESE